MPHPNLAASRLLRLQKQMAGHKLLILDELGFVPLSRPGAELLLELISRRHERGSTLITTNPFFDEWTETFGTERLTGALLDRLTHQVTILEMNGDSYRLAESRARKTTADVLSRTTRLTLQANAPWRAPATRRARAKARAPRDHQFRMHERQTFAPPCARFFTPPLTQAAAKLFAKVGILPPQPLSPNKAPQPITCKRDGAALCGEA